MISLTSEMTDTKGRRARGWLFFDAECAFCASVAKLVGPLVRKQDIALAPLQDPRVAALLVLSPEELLQAIRFLASDGRQYSGAEAIVELAREMWWARPISWIAKLTGVMQLLRVTYNWGARRAGCHARNTGPRCLRNCPATGEIRR